MMKDDEFDEKLKYLTSVVKTYPDFPKKGVLFYDIFSILSDPKASEVMFELSIEVISKRLKLSGVKVDLIVGLETRGFLIGSVIALKLGLGFIPIRKHTEKGSKLPGEIFTVKYETEYSKDQFDLPSNYFKKGCNVLIVDDLVATGGSLKAAEDLLTQAGCNVVGVFCPFELVMLKGKEKLQKVKSEDFLSLIKYND